MRTSCFGLPPVRHLLHACLLCSVVAPVLHVQAQRITFEFSRVITTESDARERAVAFHSLTFIDHLALPMGELTFGTQEANAVQGEGWFANEEWQDIGSFQWAGGTQKKAELLLSIPSGADGMLVRINAAIDSLWVTVSYDDSVLTRFRVDAYWRSSYIPLPDPSPVEKPATLPVWTQGIYFPKFPQNDRIYVLRVPTRMYNRQYSWQPSFRVDSSYEDMMTLSLLSMQGIINRSKPSVYIEWSDFPNEFWRSEMAKHVDTVYLQLDGITAINFLMRKFGHWFSGAVVYDPGVGETINLATMLAGLDDRVMLAPAQLDLPGMPLFNSYLDIRSMATEYDWDTTEGGRLRMYQWVYDNIWPKLEKRILGVISPGPPTSGRADDDYFPLSFSGRDYLIALKLTALSLDPSIPDQAALLSKFLTDAPKPIPVTGLVGMREFPMVELITRHGDVMLGMTWPGQLFSNANMTVFSGLPIEPLRYEPTINEERIISSLEGGPIAMIFTTDGDGPGFHYEHGYRNNHSWTDARSQRVGWSITPVLPDLAPLIWNYYVQTRNRAGLVCAVSGTGYIYPSLMDDQQIADYLSYTNSYLKATGLRVVHIFEGVTTFWSETYGRKYAEALDDAGYLGAILGYEWSQRGLGFYYTGSPVPTVRTALRLNSSNLDGILEDLSSRKPGEEFYNITDTYFLNQNVQYVADEDAKGGMSVRVPREFINSTSYPFIVPIGPLTLAPGRYEVKVRMKVAENTSTSPIVTVKVSYDGLNRPPALDNIPIFQLSPADFLAPNQYQEFTWSFTMDSLRSELIYGFDFGDGATDLWLDYLNSVNVDGAELPVIGTIVLDNINPYDPGVHTVALDFENRFTLAGGMLLTPEEFVASLNPEFMLDLAKRYIGTSPDIVEAEQLLIENDYLKSLLASRRAVKVLSGTTRQEREIPSEFQLYQSYPNPFNPSTTIQFDLPREHNVSLTILNVLGQEVQSLVQGKLNAGTHRITWNAGKFANGVYFYRLQAGEFAQTKKLLLLK